MTTQTQDEALRLADEFKLCNEYDCLPSMNDIDSAASELRRLHARIAELEAQAQPKREPLAEGKLRELWAQHSPYIGAPFDFARAIERAHGITKEQL